MTRVVQNHLAKVLHTKLREEVYFLDDQLDFHHVNCREAIQRKANHKNIQGHNF